MALAATQYSGISARLTSGPLQQFAFVQGDTVGAGGGDQPPPSPYSQLSPFRQTDPSADLSQPQMAQPASFQEGLGANPMAPLMSDEMMSQSMMPAADGATLPSSPERVVGGLMPPADPQMTDDPAGGDAMSVAKSLQEMLKSNMPDETAPNEAEPSEEDPVKAAEDLKQQNIESFKKAATDAGYPDALTNLGLKYVEKGYEEANFLEKPTQASGRPEGDTRSADEIIDDNPVLKNLGDQKDIKRDGLKKQCGDWSADNKDPDSRANAAFNLARVLNFIDSTEMSAGGIRDNAGDGDIQGLTKGGDARHGTEAGMLKDFAEKGYSALPDSGRLDFTKDSHVKANGSNYDNFQWGIKQVANVVNKIPVLRHTLGKALDGAAEGNNLGDVLKGGFKGYGEGLAEVGSALLRGGPEGLVAFAAADGFDTMLNDAGIKDPLGDIPIVGSMIAPGSADGYADK